MASVEPPPVDSAEEAAVKRNTDCVYFLASPLTCKKGSDCEFRHSEVALMNPRDCWYWLNGNCLNPRCGFRHPPLDVFYSASGVVPTVSQSHQMPKATDTFISGYNVKKQDVPCHFFQMNRCVKGDMCPFLHDPQIAFQSGNPSQPSKLGAADEPEARVDGSLQNCHNKQESLETHALNHSDQLVTVESSVKGEAASNQETLSKKSAFPANSLVDGSSDPDASDSALAKEESGERRSSHLDDDFQNRNDEDECLGDSSPGFDVLVDNNDDDSDYFYNNDDAGVNGALLESSMSLFDHSGLLETDHLAIYDRDLVNVADYDKYLLCYNPCGYESYDHGYHAFSERINDGLLRGKRDALSIKSSVKIGSSDLRHRLPQKQRYYGHRTGRNSDRSSNYLCSGEYPAEEQRYRSHSNRDQKFTSSRSISSRLQGRLKLPDKSDMENVDYSYGIEESEGQRRLGRPSSNRRRHEREKKRQMQDVAGYGKHSSSSTRNTNGLSTKHENVGVQPRLESSVSFEGPKSLSILLKRKREAASVNNGRLSSRDSSPRQKQGLSATISDEKIASKKAKLEVSSIEREKVIHVKQLSDHKKDDDAWPLKKRMLIAGEDGDQEYEPNDGDEDYEYDLSEEGDGVYEDHDTSLNHGHFDNELDAY